MPAPSASLAAAACAVLTEPDPGEKIARTLASAEDWRAGGLTASASPTAMPARPARPVSPQLLAPRHMPRRRSAGVGGRIALLHAVAHIELNAIDLAWDLIGRFAGLDWPVAFYDDWVAVAEDEARHFTMIEARLNELGAGYGDFPAHDGLWQAAMATAHDPLARLAVVPMLLEARGLDVTPAMIARLRRRARGHHARGNRPCRGRLPLAQPSLPRARPGRKRNLARPGGEASWRRPEAALQRSGAPRRRHGAGVLPIYHPTGLERIQFNPVHIRLR